MRPHILAGVLATLVSTGVHSDNHDDDDRGDPQIRVYAGALASTEQSPYLGGDNRDRFLPQLFVQWGRFYVRGPAAGVYVYGGDGWFVSTGVVLDLEDTERGDSSQLADMIDLDLVLLGEIVVSREADWGELELSLAADISGKHDGYLAGLSFSIPLEAGPLQIEPKAGIKWHSAAVNRYYYGVSAADALATRPRYEPDSGVTTELGATVTYPFADRHALQLEAGTEIFPGAVTDSPIVERDSRVRFGIGYIYRF